MNMHCDKFLSATHHKLESHSFRSTISTNLSTTIFAVISSTGCAACGPFFRAMAELLVGEKPSIAIHCGAYGSIDQNEHTCQICKTS